MVAGGLLSNPSMPIIFSSSPLSLKSAIPTSETPCLPPVPQALVFATFNSEILLAQLTTETLLTSLG